MWVQNGGRRASACVRGKVGAQRGAHSAASYGGHWTATAAPRCRPSTAARALEHGREDAHRDRNVGVELARRARHGHLVAARVHERSRGCKERAERLAQRIHLALGGREHDGLHVGRHAAVAVVGQAVPEHRLNEYADRLEVHHHGQPLGVVDGAPVGQHRRLARALCLVLRLFGVVRCERLRVELKLAHGEALLAAGGLELVEALFEERDSEEDILGVLGDGLCGEGDDVVGEPLVLEQKLLHTRLLDDHHHRRHVFGVEDVIFLHYVAQPAHHQVALPSPLKGLEGALEGVELRNLCLELLLQPSDLPRDHLGELAQGRLELKLCLVPIPLLGHVRHDVSPHDGRCDPAL
mmetsp:Transcript_25390/g.80498  ORF Transcript_25390/g.80498 Transcript_25390/m.80498 type:complete len:352 (+) Transcript_25390:162-1217(+)